MYLQQIRQLRAVRSAIRRQGTCQAIRTRTSWTDCAVYSWRQVSWADELVMSHSPSNWFSERFRIESLSTPAFSMLYVWRTPGRSTAGSYSSYQCRDYCNQSFSSVLQLASESATHDIWLSSTARSCQSFGRYQYCSVASWYPPLCKSGKLPDCEPPLA